ncbi:hypothetical protein F5Y05DRAFT_257996 [Hypoxylon sp. FL0543]|nr:hypothetical protein F5Y05DRAFT_257996 [Hypoxylon sp. FL0543]
MVGVPRSKRCQRCKRIKVKCDEKWPTCTPCVHAKATCSGPPTLTKFVYGGSYIATTDESKGGEVVIRFPTSAITAGNLKSIRQQGLPGGASFGHFRMSSDEPRRNLTTVADRVAARLVGFLAHENAPWEVLAAIGYTKHLPARLGDSTALRDCVALMCSTWANSRRNLPAKQLIDSNLYGKALRSLQRALDDHKQQLKCETLAAATILERLEVLFDTRRPYHRTCHAFGINGLVMKRGPPNPEDDLDVHLAFENHAALVSYWLVEGGENFFLTSPWKEAIEEAWTVLKDSVPSGRLDCYAIGYYFGYWPGLVHGFRSISLDSDVISQQARARAFRDQVAALEAKVKSLGEPIMEKARDEGRIIEEPNPETPVGRKFHFGNLDSMSFVVSYTMLRTIINRVLYHLSILMGQPDTILETESRELCKQTWMCLPFIKSLGIVPSILAASPVYMSYEAGNRIEKEYLLDLVVEVSGYKGRYPKDRKSVELLVLNAAKAMTGRGLFAASSSSLRDEDEKGDATHNI